MSLEAATVFLLACLSSGVIVLSVLLTGLNDYSSSKFGVSFSATTVVAGLSFSNSSKISSLISSALKCEVLRVSLYDLCVNVFSIFWVTFSLYCLESSSIFFIIVLSAAFSSILNSSYIFSSSFLSSRF